MKNKNLHYIHFETTLKRIKGIINDRPLVQLDDNSSAIIISPSTFILGRKVNANRISGFKSTHKNVWFKMTQVPRNNA